MAPEEEKNLDEVLTRKLVVKDDPLIWLSPSRQYQHSLPWVKPLAGNLRRGLGQGGLRKPGEWDPPLGGVVDPDGAGLLKPLLKKKSLFQPS